MAFVKALQALQTGRNQPFHTHVVDGGSDKLTRSNAASGLMAVTLWAPQCQSYNPVFPNLASFTCPRPAPAAS